LFSNKKDDKANQYIRQKIREARKEAGDTQADLAKVLEKTRVAISDLERGRVAVNASDLSLIAAYYDKPISYFFHPINKVRKKDLSSMEEELVMNFRQLPETQQSIALEYVKQQLDVIEKAIGDKFSERNL
jgi:transcriptional regulator with XRE-family HTH domain